MYYKNLVITVDGKEIVNLFYASTEEYTRYLNAVVLLHAGQNIEVSIGKVVKEKKVTQTLREIKV